MSRAASRGAIGGAAAEAGSDYRAGVAAWVVVHGLRGRALPGLDLPEQDVIPISLVVESDHAVDDLEIGLSGGSRALAQAKLRCTPGVLDDVVAQWAQAAETLNPRDRVVLATGEFTGSTRALPSALHRRRAELAGQPSSAEEKVLSRVRNGLSRAGLSTQATDAVLDAAVALQITDASETAAESMLDGAVVIWGEGQPAYWTIRREVLQLAQRREGRTMEGWVGLLRSQDFTLTTDAVASAAARFEARREVEARHRARLERKATQLDLRGLGSEFPPIQVEPGAIEFRVRVGGPDDDTEPLGTLELGRAVLRRGRVLLTGLPGSGKSTALEHLAGRWAAERDGPLPLLVYAPDLLGKPPDRSALDWVIDIVSAQADGSDRALLGDAIRERSRRGGLALFIDAVDEARHRRHDVVREIERLVDQIHADVEVIVATRDVGYADSRRLGFPELRLVPPGDGLRIARLVLQSVGDWEGQSQGWVDHRVSGVSRVTDRDRHLSETPLMLVSLAVLAARSGGGGLPSSRAKLLSELVDVVAERWEVSERRKGNLQLGPLSQPGEAALALTHAFEVLAYSLADDDSVAGIRGALVEFLSTRWGMLPGPADAAAREAIHFWDEAGVVAIADERVRPRLAVLGDIGVARYLMRLSQQDLRTAVRERIGDDTFHEALVLASGLSSGAATALIEAALGELRTELLAARACDEGAEPDAGSLASLVTALRSRLQAEPGDAWRAAKALARLPVASDQQREILRQMARSLPMSHADLAQAFALLRWRADTSEMEPVMESVLRSGPPPNLHRSGPGDPPSGALTRERILILATVDDAYQEVVEAAASRLLPSHPQLVDVIRRAAAECSARTAQRIEALLLRHGYDGLDRSLIRSDTIHRFTEFERASREAWIGLFEMIETLGEAAELSFGERRRLDSLTDFLATLRFADSSAGDLPAAWLHHRDDLKFLVETVAVLGDFDRRVLAAEAKLVLMADDQLDMELFVMDGGEGVDLDHWDAVDSEQVLPRLVHVLRGSPWLARISAGALLDAPARIAVDDVLAKGLGDFPPRNRKLAALIAIYLSSDPGERCRRWQTRGDPHVRAGVAWYTARLVLEHQATPASLLPSFRDPDASVVSAAMDGLSDGPISDEIREVLGDVAEAGFGGRGWSCPICGEWNQTLEKSCSRCNQAPPGPERQVTRLLEMTASSG